MFVGRQRELGELERRYQRGDFEFGVIYGRRRVGKTSLLNEFSRDKKCIYFTGIESTEHQNLDRFSVAIGEKLGIKGIHFDSFFEAFEYLFELAEDERLLLIIDEYPYIARTSPSLASTLQLLIDRHKATSKLFLILCGSSMSYMIDEVVAYRAPLYGRKTLEMKVEPLSYFESMEMLGDWSREDAALIYGLFGGLYNLKDDPFENHEMAKDNPEMVKTLFAAMKDRLVSENACYPVDKNKRTLKPVLPKM